MTNYRAILLYHSKGNTTTQIATICQCSRTTVIKTIKRAVELNLQLPIPNAVSDKELYSMLYPNRSRNEEYYLPDWIELEKDKTKRSFSKYRAWQKYCRIANRLGLKAYGKTHFYNLYNQYFSLIQYVPKSEVSEVLKKIRYYEFAIDMVSKNYGVDSDQYIKIILERDSWCKALRLDKSKIFFDR